MTAATNAHGRLAGGAVEGFGHGGPPVHRDGFLGVVPDRDAPDVEGLAGPVVGQIQPAEDQRGIADVQLRHPIVDLFVDDISLEARLMGAAAARFHHGVELSSLVLGLFEDAMRFLDVFLLSLEVGVDGRVLRVRIRGVRPEIG